MTNFPQLPRDQKNWKEEEEEEDEEEEEEDDDDNEETLKLFVREQQPFIDVQQLADIVNFLLWLHVEAIRMHLIVVHLFQSTAG